MNSVVITAGGSSSRFNNQNKLLYKIKGKPVIAYSVELFCSLSYIDEVIISAKKEDIMSYRELFKNLDKVKIIEGGKTRQESVYNGLKNCFDCKYVIIHDGARPFITEDVILKCLNNAKKIGASIVAVKTIDTVKIVDDNGIIVSTPERKTLWNAQTPQIFNYEKILKLHEKYKNESFTDDSLLFEQEGFEVSVTEGEYSNFKITTLEDVRKFESHL